MALVWPVVAPIEHPLVSDHVQYEDGFIVPAFGVGVQRVEDDTPVLGSMIGNLLVAMGDSPERLMGSLAAAGWL